MLNNINTTHTQYPDSCVVTAYALVNNAFTREAILDVFRRYCRHHQIEFNRFDFLAWCRGRNITREEDKLQAFSSWHFCYGQGNIGQDRSSNNVLQLHQTSPEFAECRAVFNGVQYPSTLPHEQELTKVLREEEAIMISGCGMHAVLIYHDGNSLRVRNPTTRGEPYRVANFGEVPRWVGGSGVTDTILYKRNSKEP